MAGRNVTLIVCGAPLAERAADLAAELISEGFAPTVIGTPASVGYIAGGGAHRSGPPSAGGLDHSAPASAGGLGRSGESWGGWLDREAIGSITGEPVRVAFRRPDEPRPEGRPTAVVVCPATFNTINKAVAGVSDTYALAVLCEAIGLGVPLLVVPMVNDLLWQHSAWTDSLAFLDRAGAVVLDIGSGEVGASPVAAGSGAELVSTFEPRWVSAQLRSLGLRP